MKKNFIVRARTKIKEEISSALNIFASSDYYTVERCEAAILQSIDDFQGDKAAILLAERERREKELKFQSITLLCYVIFYPIALVFSLLLVYAIITLPFGIRSVTICLISVMALLYDGIFFRKIAYAEHNRLKRNLFQAVDNVSKTLKGISSLKGGLQILLLEELIKNELSLPNTFKTSAKQSFTYYRSIYGYSEKHFEQEFFKYQKRGNIIFESENARSTHVKYMDILMENYEAIENNELLRQAEKLRFYFVDLTIEKGKKKR